MAEPKIYSIQPRFKFGDQPASWAMIDGIFKLGTQLPPYGSEMRDAYLSYEWMSEPMTAGVFSTWTEKAQTLEWKVTGGRNNANIYARLLQGADGGAGWTYHEGVCALDYLSTDKGSMEEEGRADLTPDLIKRLQDLSRQKVSTEADYNILMNLVDQCSSGRVSDIQHLDSSRMIKVGLPGMRWRYYPELGNPISIPDNNIIQVTSMPNPKDRFRGYGFCALSRIIDAKNLMLGYINYYRQEIGDLPPELIVIVNGLSGTAFQDALNKYKMDKKASNLDEYGKIFWLGSDDPMTPVAMQTINLINSTKSFDFRTMVEWWMKTLALNVGEDVGEFWLLQRGESKTVQSIQAMKSKGKGVARYVQEKERKYNTKIMPYGVKFEYDQMDDDADKMHNDILALKISNLATLAKIGLEGGGGAPPGGPAAPGQAAPPAQSSPEEGKAYWTKDEIRKFAIQWDIIPPELTGDEAPTVLGAMLKQISHDDIYTVNMHLEEKLVSPLLKGKEKDEAKFLYNYLGGMYTNGFIKHKSVKEFEPVL